MVLELNGGDQAFELIICYHHPGTCSMVKCLEEGKERRKKRKEEGGGIGGKSEEVGVGLSWL
jgi:hypothetical protein